MVFKKIKLGKCVVPMQSLVSEDMNPRKTRNESFMKISVWMIVVLYLLLFTVILLSAMCLLALVFQQLLLRRLESFPESVADVVSCYYNMPTPANTTQLMPSSIHPHLCTHINVAFARVKNKEIYLDDDQLKALPDIIKLKAYNPDLKILLSVGGAGNDVGFSEMVVNHASRKIFIKSIKNILRKFSLDGVDLDWEFPAIKKYQKVLKKRERQHFSQLLREIRAEYIREKQNYLLTVAVASPQAIVDVAYDVDQINMYVDYANIMTYDFHFYTKFTPFTGLNSPLYARPGEQLYLATLNINNTVQMYKDKGLDPLKIVVGIPTYGHSFTLVNSDNTKVGSPASGYGQLGSYGFVNYPDICELLRESHNHTVVKEDVEAKVPYLYKGCEWISYDNADSVVSKATYIRERKLRGAMIYSLNADDYNGICDKLSGRVRFPLATSVRNTLNVNRRW